MLNEKIELLAKVKKNKDDLQACQLNTAKDMLRKEAGELCDFVKSIKEGIIAISNASGLPRTTVAYKLFAMSKNRKYMNCYSEDDLRDFSYAVESNYKCRCWIYPDRVAWNKDATIEDLNIILECVRFLKENKDYELSLLEQLCDQLIEEIV